MNFVLGYRSGERLALRLGGGGLEQQHQHVHGRGGGCGRGNDLGAFANFGFVVYILLKVRMTMLHLQRRIMLNITVLC